MPRRKSVSLRGPPVLWVWLTCQQTSLTVIKWLTSYCPHRALAPDDHKYGAYRRDQNRRRAAPRPLERASVVRAANRSVTNQE